MRTTTLLTFALIAATFVLSGCDSNDSVPVPDPTGTYTGTLTGSGCGQEASQDVTITVTGSGSTFTVSFDERSCTGSYAGNTWTAGEECGGGFDFADVFYTPATFTVVFTPTSCTVSSTGTATGDEGPCETAQLGGTLTKQ